MATTFMNLELPTVSVTLGPEWATELNAALEVVDEHDHSSGKGVKVKPAGLDINSNLDFQSNKAFALKSTQFTDQISALSGASNASSLYSNSGNLYYTNGSGVAIQITSGGAIVASPGAVDSFQFDSFASNLSIAPSDPYVFISVDTTASRTITLPLASAVSAGRIYIIKDESGQSEANPLTLACSGADTIDGASSQSISSNYATIFVIGNGATKWFIL